MGSGPMRGREETQMDEKMKKDDVVVCLHVSCGVEMRRRKTVLVN